MADWYLIIPGLALVTLCSAGDALVYHLGAGSTPQNLKPVANVWLKLGGTPESFKVVLWVLFVLIALSLLIILGSGIYLAITDLGRPFK